MTILASLLEPRGEVALTPHQLKVLGILTRTASTLSGLGVITIIAVFCLSKHFRNPMHRLIFINAFYNAFDVTCTMISISGYADGNKSALCQFQGFLNQMFPVADVLWTLVMAVDVYLIVFRCYDTQALKRLEWKYMVAITAFTFASACTMLFINTEEKGPMYGGVTLWCAIAPNWVLFRIVIYYVPIWTSIFITMVLYIIVGIEIVKRRQALKSITSDTMLLDMDDTVMPADDPSQSPSSDVTNTATNYSYPTNHKTKTSTSYSSASGGSILTSRDHSNTNNLEAAAPKRSSLSFRQYILMPLFFFLALLTVWVCPSTNRVAAFIDPTFGSYPLLLLVGITGSLRGFWNSLVFILVGMKSWKRRRREEEEEEELAMRARPGTRDTAPRNAGDRWDAADVGDASDGPSYRVAG